MSRAVADTSVFIATEAGRPLGELPDALAVSVITAAELELGVLRALIPEVRATRLGTLSCVRAIYPLLEIDGVTASCYARLADEQLLAGRKPRRHDTWIAATAIRHAAAVITQDTDFTAFTSVTVAGPQRPQLSDPSEVILAANAHRDLQRTVVDIQVLAHGPADASGGWMSAR